MCVSVNLPVSLGSRLRILNPAMSPESPVLLTGGDKGSDSSLQRTEIEETALETLNLYLKLQVVLGLGFYSWLFWLVEHLNADAVAFWRRVFPFVLSANFCRL